MNTNKFFELASKNGIEVSEVNVYKNTAQSIEIFRGEITSNQVNSSSNISARGIYKGKFGFARTEKDDSTTPLFLVNSIKDIASLIEKEDESIIFKGSEKYHKKNVFNPKLEDVSLDKFLKVLFELEEKLQKADSKVTDVQVGFTKKLSEKLLTNSYGLKLKTKSNYFVIYADAVMKQGDEIKNASEVILENDFDKINVDELVKKIIDKGNAKFGGTTIKSSSYKAVFDKEVVGDLLGFLLESCSSEAVQKHSSFFEGKVNQQVLSKKITISEEPLKKNIYFNYFDDEGVATYNKKVFTKGVLNTLFYNLTTAKKDGTISTGNGESQGGKIGVGFNQVTVKPGKLTLEELYQKIGNGVYITSISGLHAGMNAISGDFSLEGEGFHVVNGKLAGPLTLITVGGNLFKLFNDVIAVGSDKKLLLSSTETPSMAFKNVKISAC